MRHDKHIVLLARQNLFQRSQRAPQHLVIALSSRRMAEPPVGIPDVMPLCFRLPYLIPVPAFPVSQIHLSQIPEPDAVNAQRLRGKTGCLCRPKLRRRVDSVQMKLPVSLLL